MISFSLPQVLQTSFCYHFMEILAITTQKRWNVQNRAAHQLTESFCFMVKIQSFSFSYNIYPLICVLSSYLELIKFCLLWTGSCANRDISISQSKDTTSGIPRYIVQIVNTCINPGSCAPSDIRLHCGWFASARVINPTIFKRLSFDDCLVNGGKPLKTSQTISFTYSNSFMYPLSIKSAKFC